MRQARPARPQDTTHLLYAPDDCSNSAAIRQFTGAVRSCLASGAKAVTINVSHVVRMNVYLLGVILQMVREASSTGARIRVEGATEDFRQWAGVCRVLSVLEREGIIAPAEQTEVKPL